MDTISLPNGLKLSPAEAEALSARLLADDRDEAAARLNITRHAYDRRFSRGIAKLPYRVRNAYRAACPKKLPVAKMVKAVSLSDVINI